MVESVALEMRSAGNGTEGSNPSLSANTLSFHIRSQSLKPSFSAAFSVIRIHVRPCQSTGDRLEMWERMWEIWWHGKALRYCCEGSNTPRAAWRWRRPVSPDSAGRRQELDVSGAEEWQPARLWPGQRVQSLTGHGPGAGTGNPHLGRTRAGPDIRAAQGDGHSYIPAGGGQGDRRPQQDMPDPSRGRRRSRPMCSRRSAMCRFMRSPGP